MRQRSNRRLSSRWLAFLVVAAVGAAGTPCVAAEAMPELTPRTDGPIDLAFLEPTYVVKVYRAWGELTGIDVLTDPELSDQAIPAVEIRAATVSESLAYLTRLYRHFHVVLDQHAIVIVDDTPEKRREYDAFETRSFALEHTEVKTALRVLSDLIGTHHVTAAPDLGRVALLDTPRRLEIAGHILEMSDTPVPEVIVDVELLATSRLSDTSALPSRLSAPERARFDRATVAKTVATSRLSALGGASTRLTADFSTMSRTSANEPEASVALQLNARLHAVRVVTLDLYLRTTGAHGKADVDGFELPIHGGGELRTTIRLRDDETYLLPGLIPTTVGEELIVALTPHIVQPAVKFSDVPEALWLDPEEMLDLGLQRVQEIDAKERVREQLRQRLRNLPRRWQDSEFSERKEQDGP